MGTQFSAKEYTAAVLLPAAQQKKTTGNGFLIDPGVLLGRQKKAGSSNFLAHQVHTLTHHGNSINDANKKAQVLHKKRVANALRS